MFGWLKKKAANAVNAHQTKGLEATAPNPLGIQLNSKIVINNRNPRIYKSLCPAFDAAYIVSHIGTFKMGDSLFTRVYFKDDASYLQIITDAKDLADIHEIRFFYEDELVQPSTKEGWAEWTSSPKYKIGNSAFEHKEREFSRMESWADPDPERVPQVEIEEKVTATKDPKSYVIQHECMGYGRWLNEEHKIAEYIQLSSFECIDAGNLFFAGVGIDVGIDLNVADIEVVY